MPACVSEKLGASVSEQEMSLVLSVCLCLRPWLFDISGDPNLPALCCCNLMVKNYIWVCKGVKLNWRKSRTKPLATFSQLSTMDSCFIINTIYYGLCWLLRIHYHLSFHMVYGFCLQPKFAMRYVHSFFTDRRVKFFILNHHNTFQSIRF
jgi:hypothetical protein